MPRSSNIASELVGQDAILVGFGLTGTGESGASTRDNVKRGAVNTIDARGPDQNYDYSGNIVLSDFDCPDLNCNIYGSASPRSLEGSIAPGDSGGPWIVGGKIAAVSSFGQINNSIDEVHGFYGFFNGASAVRASRDWINSTMGGVNWINRGTSGFRTTTNWGDGVVPTNADVRFSLPTATGSTPTITHNANDVVDSMTVEFGRHVFEMNGFSMTATGATKIERAGQLVVREGPLIVNANLDLSNNGYLEIAADASLDVNRTEASDALYIGNSGQSNILQLQGGRIDVTGRTYVGMKPNSTGEFNLSSGQVFTLGSMFLGSDGTGTLRHSQVGTVGTRLSVTGDLVLGQNAGGRGVYEKTSSGLTAVFASSNAGGGAGHLVIGRSSTSESLVDTSAGTIDAVQMRVAEDPNSRGRFVNRGSASLVVHQTIQVGVSGTGTVEMVSGDTMSAGTSLTLGVNASGNGTFDVTGGTTTVAETIVVGNHGRGYLQIGGTATVHGRALSLGRGPAAQGTVVQGGGTLQVSGGVFLGDFAGVAATSTYYKAGGELTIGEQFRIGDRSSARYEQYGGSTIAGRYDFASDVVIGANAGSTGAAKVFGGGFTTRSNLTIGDGGVGDFEQGGDAKVRVNGDLVIGNSGRYDLSGGTLEVTGSIRGGGLSTNRLVFYGGVLTSGAVDGNLRNQGGTLAPSTAWSEDRLLDINGDYFETPEATLKISTEIASEFRLGTDEYGQWGGGEGTTLVLLNTAVQVTGHASLAGNLELPTTYTRAIYDNGVEIDWHINTQFPPAPAITILTAGTLNGAFANVVPGGRLYTSDGRGSFQVNYGVDSLYDPTAVVLSDWIAETLPGDFNHDGYVDAADYTVWRDGDSPYSSMPLSVWQTNYGMSLASYAALHSQTRFVAVPEPAQFAMAVLTSLIFCSKRLSTREELV